MWCHDINCPNLDDHNFRRCTKYPVGYMFFVERQGYCPVINKYADPEKQAALEKRQRAAQGKTRQGQQKQKKKK